MPVEGSIAHPVRLDPWQRIINVGWPTDGFGVLMIDYPERMGSFDFEPHNDDWRLMGDGVGPYGLGVEIPKEDLDQGDQPAIFPVGFTVLPFLLRSLYDDPGAPHWTYYTVALINSSHGFDNSAEIAYLNSIYPGITVTFCSEGQMPYPQAGYGITTDSLLPFNCSGPPDPGRDNYYWSHVIQSQGLDNTRNLVRNVYLINFSKWPKSQTAPIDILNRAAGFDERLGPFDIALSLRIFAKNKKLFGAFGTVTGEGTPRADQARSISYTNEFLGRFNKAGFVA